MKDLKEMQNDPTKYWSRGELESVQYCPACNSTEPAKTVSNRHDNEQSMPDKWRMQQCHSCQSIWLNPRPDQLSLPRAYDSYYTHNDAGQSIPPGLPGKLISGYLNKRFSMQRKPALGLGYFIFSAIEPWRLKLEFYGRHLSRIKSKKKEGPLLDIGCGNGEFLKLAREMGWETLGCEIDPKAIDVCKKNNIKIIEGDGFSEKLQENHFPVITMSHVLEHVTDQPKLIQRTYDLLKPDGQIWISLPNPQSIGLLLYGEAWREFHPPYHLSIPSQKLLKKWLERSGFIDIKFLRRGAHANKAWETSDTISKKQNLPKPNKIKKIATYIITNILSTISHRYSEETVVIAKKPR